MLFEFLNDRTMRTIAENADENVRIFKIRRDIHVVDRDEHVLERKLACDDGAELAPDELVHAEHSMFHEKLRVDGCARRENPKSVASLSTNDSQLFYSF